MSQVNKPHQWRSYNQLEGNEEYNRYLHREFQDGASLLDEPVSRRNFLKLLGASVAFAGLTGCGVRRPVQKIRPYAKRPEEIIPGEPLFYATACQLGEDVVGVVVETHEGRPTKIEGNPLHPGSLGAVKHFHQASILNLYDPDRLQQPIYNGAPAEKVDFNEWLLQTRRDMRAKRGQGVVILTGTQVSPTFYRLLDKLRQDNPQLTVLRYDAVNSDNQLTGLNSVTGDWVTPVVDYEKADIIVSFHSDFLGNEPGNIPASMAFSKRRTPEHPAGLNRLYVIENHYTITGGKADHRIKAKPSDVEGLLYLLANELMNRGLIGSTAIVSSLKNDLERRVAKFRDSQHNLVLNAIIGDLLNSRGKSAVLAGPNLSPSAHALTHLINESLGNINQTITYYRRPFSDQRFNRMRHDESLVRLAEMLDGNRVETLLILGGNPIFSAPGDMALESKLGSVKSIVHLTESRNETSRFAHWAIPKSHYLESWGDLVSIDGTVSIVQPMIRPMYDSVSDIELLSLLSGSNAKGYSLVRTSWRNGNGASDTVWNKWLHDGVTDARVSGYGRVMPSSRDNGVLRGLKRQLSAVSSETLEVAFYPSYTLYDGTFANNGWLQELPDPSTKLTWDNAALMSSTTARQLDVKTEDVISVKVGRQTVELPVFIMPGHANDSVSLFFGYGRSVVGRVGENTGFNVYPLRHLSGMGYTANAEIQKTGGIYTLASTQDHGSMENRPIFRSATLSEYEKQPDFAKEMVEVPDVTSLWKDHQYTEGYQWGMAIDLAKCTGCNACVTACQSENNIPIVGKSEVLVGREMHWIRVDRYFVDEEEAPGMVQQPIPCLHCETAPCEQVCPVAATVHSSEGLNDMVYNRCIGTRYCGDNCPAKVRRFNFFDYNQRNPQARVKDRIHLFDYFKEPDPKIQMQFNPDVTVRMRGVMEKCTYCVQRINEGKHRAANENRSIRDGEIQTACQQTCPTNAIVFGNINDPNSKVARLKKLPRNYEILEELYLRSRTTFLAAIRNPHPRLYKLEMMEKEKVDHS